MLTGMLAAFSSSNVVTGLNPPSIGKWVPIKFGSTSYTNKRWPRLESVDMPENILTVPQVNQWVNKNIEYEPEQNDYWKSPKETLLSGKGDCEDFAILKHQMLNQTGYASWVLICKDLITKKDHAICITLFEALNTTDKSSVPIKKLRDYTPIIAINDGGVWVYGKRTR